MDNRRPTLAPRGPSCVAVALLLTFSAAAWSHPGIDQQIADVTARIAEEPTDAGLFLRRGELHRIHRDWPAAERDYRQARKLDPDLAEVDLSLGTMLLDADRPKEAEKALDRFLDKRPDSVRGQVARARARARLGKHLTAVKDYDRALAAADDGLARPGYYLERARALEAAGDKHLDAALRGLDDGLARLGYPVTLQLFAIELELKAGRPDAALARVDRIAAMSQRKETWLLRKGEILETAGRTAEARDQYRQALDAIAALPVSRRGNRAVQRLESDARAGIERLSSGG